MAKRRKRFSGTPDEHSTYAKFYAQGVYNEAKNVKRRAEKGRCVSAAESLYSLGTEFGGLVSERRGMRAEDGPGDRIHDAVNSAKAAFNQFCLKKREG